MRHKRVVVAHYGGPEVIIVAEEEIPTPRPGEARVKVLAAGVSLPDVLAREGVHPETPRVPYTPGWDLVGTIDQLGGGVNGLQLGQTVTAMPIHGCYAQYVCVPQQKLVAVPAGLDPAEAVAVVLNYITAYQMLHRSAKARPGQRMLIHGASGGVCSAMLQLAKLAEVEMYGTCSTKGAAVVRELGCHPYRLQERGLREGDSSPYRRWRRRRVRRHRRRQSVALPRCCARGRPCGDLRFPVENAGGTHGFRERGASSHSRVR